MSVTSLLSILRNSRLSGAHSVAINSAPNFADPVVSENKTKLCCTKPECNDLRMALVFWRDAKWKEIRLSNPFLTHNWVLLDEHIDSLVDKGHIILNAPQVDALLIEKFISWITDDALTASLIVLLEQFRKLHWECDKVDITEWQLKRSHLKKDKEDKIETMVHDGDGSTYLVHQWQIPNFRTQK
ncbi:hypothetical protein BDQ17DRAFT_1429510 [Cyathus striatus]|nr:hypothetical protein BDQ17DRAFT_1429510 [Cyathus striatus]